MNVHMAKKAAKLTAKERRLQMIVLPILLVVGAGVIILTILSIITLPGAKPGAQRGVGADGFHAYVEDNTDLGVRSVVSKNQVASILGKKAKSVGDADVSKVFNYNGDRSQTLTFSFVRSDGAAATLYVDMKLYKNMGSLEADHIYVATAKAGTVNGHPAYYKHAQTIDNTREYHIMVVNGLRAYRFVIAQPLGNIKISEIDADALLKKLAAEAKL